MKHTKFQLVIFDWSGVIADTFENFYFSAMAVFKAYGGPHLSREEARKEFRQPYMQFYNKFLPDVSIDEAKKVYVPAIQSCPRPPMFPGMKELLFDLYERGIHMGVISGDAKESLLAEVEEFGIEHFFHDILWDVYDKTDAVEKMIAAHHIAKDECVFVGDSMHEVEVGKSVGCKTCAVTWGFVSKEKLHVLHPDFLVDTPAELRQIIL